MRVLVVNAGSSSLKLRVLDDRDQVTGTADLPAPEGTVDAGQLRSALGSLGDADAAGHRIVHGGTFFTGPVRIDDRVLARLRSLTDLAPLHQPKSLAALAAVQAARPGLPAVACFDTAFHASLPEPAATYALPREWRQRWALRRYGFHGLSHSYCSRRAAELAAGAPPEGGSRTGGPREGGSPERGSPERGSPERGSPERGSPAGGSRVVTCHLGAGASLAAVRDGVSVDTTMGFTPLEGLVMATRSGSVDPGLVLWLEEHAGMPSAELAATLEQRSGLLGLAGTADMREVVTRAGAGGRAARAGGGEARAGGGEARAGAREARLALDVYVHRLRAGIAAMAAALGGLDILVFTGGVGENAPEVRAEAAAGLGFLGVELDPDRNRAAPPGAADWEIGRPGSPARTFVIAAREDIEISRQVRTVLAGAGRRP